MMARNRRKSGDRAESADRPACPSCGAATVSKARFCHACGTSLDGGAPRKWSPRRLAGLGAAVVLISAAVFAVVTYSEPDRPPPLSSAPPASMFAAPPVASGAALDLSRMTPRAAADRLFNRIMTASERGNRAEALRFAPMAIEAYGRLVALDADARYHLGLIHGVVGNRANVDRQIAALRRGAPRHLLALALEHDGAEQTGDAAALARVRAAFAAAYDAEIATPRPEYQAHRNTIERIRAAVAARPTPSTAGPGGAAQEGAAMFATYCAACHGPGAAGSNKGPPLVHNLYEPNHHGDDSFLRAVRRGVRSHHWSFGDMPPK